MGVPWYYKKAMTPSPSNAVVAAEAEADDVEEINSEEVVVEREGMRRLARAIERYREVYENK